MYDVRLGNIDLYGVLSVDITKGRNITIYDSIGGGKFPVPKNKNLNVYNMELEISEFKQYKYNSEFMEAKKIFKKFDKLLLSDKPVRLIVYNDGRKISQLVMLENYAAKEVYAGVYEVSLKCVEYVDNDVRTTNILQIKRQGKIPNPPKRTIVGNPAEYTEENTGESLLTPDVAEWRLRNRFVFLNKKTGGEYLNPTLIPEDEEIAIYNKVLENKQSEPWTAQYYSESKSEHEDALVKGAKKTFQGISEFFSKSFNKSDYPTTRWKDW